MDRRLVCATILLGTALFPSLSVVGCGAEEAFLVSPGIPGEAGTPTERDGADAALADAPSDSLSEGSFGNPIEELAGGYNHVCARRRHGEVYCWGANDSAQLGIPADDAGHATPVRVALPDGGALTATNIGAHGAYTCARLTDGAVRCWGGADFNIDEPYALGRGDGSQKNPPLPVRTPDGELRVDAGWIVAGYQDVCAGPVDDLYCWGGAQKTAIIGPATTELASPFALQSQLPGLRLLALGRTTACAVVQATSGSRDVPGAVKCWGSRDGDSLVLGVETSGATCDYAGNTLPCVRDPTDVPGLSAGVTDLAVTLTLACAVKDEEVWCWGNNKYRWIDPDAGDVPVPRPTRIAGLTGVLRIGVGDSFACALLKAEGTVHCWGVPAPGTSSSGLLQLDTGGNPVLKGAVQLAVSGGHVCARTAQSRVYCVGSAGGSVMPMGFAQEFVVP